MNIKQKLDTLSFIAYELNKHNIKWALGASAMLYFKGIVKEFNDLDIRIMEEDVDTVIELLEEYGTLVEKTPDDQFGTKRFLHYVINDVEIDIMAGFSIITGGYEYEFPLEEFKTFEKVDLDGVSIYLDNLDDWSFFYTLMERLDKALLIDKYYGIYHHEIPPVFDQDSKILILGSFPSVKSREANFYYMHPQNRFWPLLERIYGENFTNEDIYVKGALLFKNGIALYDVIDRCKIVGSKDSSITDILPADIEELISRTNIKHIYINGRKAYDLFIKYNKELADMATYLPSTSPSNAKFNMDDLYEHWKVIKQ